MRRTGNLVGWKENLEPIYYASKALVNAYGRFALPKLLKPNQSSFLIHPGWYLYIYIYIYYFIFEMKFYQIGVKQIWAVLWLL
jgi:hypothetical protein